MKYILNQTALKCLLEIKTYQKDISVQFGLECISSNFLVKKNEISVRCGIPTYSVGLQGFVDYQIPHPTVGLTHFCLESIGPPVGGH